MTAAIAWNNSQSFAEYVEQIKTMQRPHAGNVEVTAGLLKSMPTSYIIHTIGETGGSRCFAGVGTWSLPTLMWNVVLPRNWQN